VEIPLNPIHANSSQFPISKKLFISSTSNIKSMKYENALKEFSRKVKEEYGKSVKEIILY